MHREDPLPLRLYARALVILPRRFRESSGAGMAAMLADEWRERRGLGHGALLAGALVDLLWTAMLLIALVIAYGGVTLARYADADDAPGGVVMGWVLVASAVALGARAFLRRES